MGDCDVQSRSNASGRNLYREWGMLRKSDSQIQHFNLNNDRRRTSFFGSERDGYNIDAGLRDCTLQVQKLKDFAVMTIRSMNTEKMTWVKLGDVGVQQATLASLLH